MVTYTYFDGYGPRIHVWGLYTPEEKWAVGNGPIEYISRAKALEIMGL